MSTENLIRITVLARRNPNLSESEFHKHWTSKHGPLVTSWLQQHGIVKYVQYHTTQAHKALTTQNTAPYDGMADFYVRKYADFEAAYEDPFYLDMVKKDEQYLFDVDSMLVTVGIEVGIIDNGKKAEGRAVEF